MTITLKHNDIIKIPGSRQFDMIQVSTFAGWKGGAAWKKDWAAKPGDDIVWTTKNAPCITDAPKAVKDAERAREQAAFDAAPMLENGTVVEVDGKSYRVRINGVRYSDPVAFVAV